jgi:hypothetical protein
VQALWTVLNCIRLTKFLYEGARDAAMTYHPEPDCRVFPLGPLVFAFSQLSSVIQRALREPSAWFVGTSLVAEAIFEPTGAIGTTIDYLELIIVLDDFPIGIGNLCLHGNFVFC